MCFVKYNSLEQVKTYVGSDGKLHFVDASGADSVLPFSSKPIDLGTGTSFNVSSYDGYENFTVNNFIVEPLNATGTLAWFNHATNISAKGSGSSTLNLNKAYNQSTGVFSAYTTFSSTIIMSDSTFSKSWTGTGTVHAYLIP